MKADVRTVIVRGVAILCLFEQVVCHVQRVVSGNAVVAPSPQLSSVEGSGVNSVLLSLAQVEHPGDSHVATVAESSSANATVLAGDRQNLQAPSPLAPAKIKPGFFTRWGKAYMADWTGTTAPDPDTRKRHGTPAPIPAPPYPASDWPIGGTQEIGAPDYSTYKLQTAIDGDPIAVMRSPAELG
jgi:hypothetical protein